MKNKKTHEEGKEENRSYNEDFYCICLQVRYLELFLLCWFQQHIKNDIIVEGILYVVGQGFIRLMKMLVVPLVFCSLVCGSMSIGDTKKLGTVGVRTLVFYLATTALAVTVALSVGNLINPGVGLDMSAIKTNASICRDYGRLLP